MKKKHLALISLYVIENNGPRLIAALLRNHGYPVTEIYFKDLINNKIVYPTKKELKSLVDLLKKINPDIIGISVRASAYHEIAGKITSLFKRELNLPIIWGGMHATVCPEESLKYADIVSIGEAELAMLDLMRHYSQKEDITTTPNFWFKTKGGIKKNEIRPLLEDLDALPFRDYVSQDKYLIKGHQVKQGEPIRHYREFFISASRGCPFRPCSFCSNSQLEKVFKGKGRYYRIRSVDNVIEELRQAKKTFKRLKRIRFDDEVFNFSKNWMREFARQYAQLIKLPFEILLDPRAINEENLRLLKEAGLKTVNLGIQNTERINKSLYNRNTTNQEVLRAARAIHNLNLAVHYHLLFDDPVSNTRDKSDLFQLLLRIPRPYDLYLFSLIYFPRSALTERLLKENLITENEVEINNQKVLRQWRVDLSYPRPPEDRFWLSLIVLLSKNFVPLSFIRWLSRRKFLMSHPSGLVYFAQFSNLIKMAGVVLAQIIKGEMTWIKFKEWANLRSLITQ
ncbi:MAG TPA: B12-binding domain-containing radical SAM protein [bacterium]|nr:B12-binding domain-containing radical SAM protein [bacterium]